LRSNPHSTCRKKAIKEDKTFLLKYFNTEQLHSITPTSHTHTHTHETTEHEGLTTHSSVYSDLNALVANYLFTEGYLDAASHFAREASLDPAKTNTDLESIQARRDIRSCVQRGKIQEALDKVVELDPEVSFYFPPSFEGDRRESKRRKGILQRSIMYYAPLSAL